MNNWLNSSHISPLITPNTQGHYPANAKLRTLLERHFKTRLLADPPSHWEQHLLMSASRESDVLILGLVGAVNYQS